MLLLTLIGLALGVPGFLIGVLALYTRAKNRRARERALHTQEIVQQVGEGVRELVCAEITAAVEPLRKELLPNGGNSLTDRVVRIDTNVQSQGHRLDNVDVRLNNIDTRLNTESNVKSRESMRVVQGGGPGRS